ncbi:MAG: alanine:cation symporter family protein [Lachnospiraceae bacterium]|nr:alanine:cation symporter family protein [Lachnospiraceae bacterium]
MELFASIISNVNGVIWGIAVIVLLMVVAAYFTVMTRGIQFRRFGEMFRLMFEKEEETAETSISAFQALATTVGSRVGTGNIAGVATAIFFGGPGAVVWMWITALIGCSTGIIECILGQAYKDRSGNELVGGPAYYATRGLKSRPLALLYVFATFVGCFLLAAVQTYTSASTINDAFNVTPIVTGAVITVATALVIMGGIKRIGQVAEVLAPLMCGIYLLVGLFIMITNAGRIPGVIAEMFRCAFTKDAVYGAIFGTTVEWGIKRGFFSCDAGNGMAPIMSSTANTSHPVKQGLVQGLSVYIDTLFVCSITGLSILLSGAYNVTANGVDETALLVENAPGVHYGVLFMQEAMKRSLGTWSGGLLAVIMTIFVFTTILSYSYEVESSIHYLAGNNRKLINIGRIALLAMCFFGSFIEGGTVWDMGDTGVGIMTWFNVITIVLLSPVAFRIIKDYDKQRKAGLDPLFDPKTVGIDDPNGIWDEYVAKKKARGDYENKELGY